MTRVKVTTQIMIDPNEMKTLDDALSILMDLKDTLSENGINHAYQFSGVFDIVDNATAYLEQVLNKIELQEE